MDQQDPGDVNDHPRIFPWITPYDRKFLSQLRISWGDDFELSTHDVRLLRALRIANEGFVLRGS